jgi:hypothetical protein
MTSSRSGFRGRSEPRLWTTSGGAVLLSVSVVSKRPAARARIEEGSVAGRLRAWSNLGGVVFAVLAVVGRDALAAT